MGLGDGGVGVGERVEKGLGLRRVGWGSKEAVEPPDQGFETWGPKLSLGAYLPGRAQSSGQNKEHLLQ